MWNLFGFSFQPLPLVMLYTSRLLHLAEDFSLWRYLNIIRHFSAVNFDQKILTHTHTAKGVWLFSYSCVHTGSYWASMSIKSVAAEAADLHSMYRVQVGMCSAEYCRGRHYSYLLLSSISASASVYTNKGITSLAPSIDRLWFFLSALKPLHWHSHYPSNFSIFLLKWGD